MKTKTIKSIIHRKFNAFLESISDPDLKKRVEENTICTGGCIASMLLREPVNDYDFYFRDYATALAVANYYVGKFMANPPPKFMNGRNVLIKVLEKVYRVLDGADITGTDVGIEVTEPRVQIYIKSAGAASEEDPGSYQYFEADQTGESGREYIEKLLDIDPEEEKKATKDKPPFRPVFLSSNAISLSDDVQLIVRFHGEPDQIHANYDFVHVTNYWTSWNNELVIRKDALECLITKELRYIGSKYPLCSLIRLRKFIGRGWTVTAGQILKIAVNLQKFDLTNIGVLEEQLTGVDVAYFNDLIARLKEKDPEATKVDANYLMQLVDKLF